ncbi:MAG: hypothetical protein JW910_02720 [Anaerolineae bacterium]|nr:hypothetical protein [Anaerolineae bacterium]
MMSVKEILGLVGSVVFVVFGVLAVFGRGLLRKWLDTFDGTPEYAAPGWDAKMVLLGIAIFLIGCGGVLAFIIRLGAL